MSEQFKMLRSLLTETPLPDTWDKDVYNGRQNFSKMIKYATEQAKKLGTGSSRVAFEVEYEGRPTVLKIAKNAKGIAQNEEESLLLNDYYLQGLELIIPVIDYDEENDPPRWIHTEKAEKIKNSDFKRLTGVGLEELIIYCAGKAYGGNFAGVRSLNGYYKSFYKRKFDQIVESGEIKVDENGNHESELVSSLIDMLENYTHIVFADFTVLKNWGLYKGKPVIIDIGFTEEVKKLHYD